MDNEQLHNRTHHLSESDWEQYEDSPPITKGVLDDQQLDESEVRHRNDINESNSLLPTFQPDLHINVHYIKAYYCGPQDGYNVTTRVSERPGIMQWRGEHFKCRVGFSFESAIPRSNWTIGLAQACDYITLSNTFEEAGSYKWEFQPLKTGLHTMVNDSNGSQWPFYSHKSSMIDIRSGNRIRPNFHELKFSDYFYPTMHWHVESGGQVSRLSHVVRRQGFKAWFVIIKRGVNNPKDGFYSRYLQFRPQMDEVYVLKSMQWRYNIELKFDCLQQLGSRCVSINDTQEEQPVVFDTIDPIPTSALVPPNCNSCQSLIFYPTNHDHQLVLKKPPEEAVVTWPEWRNSMTSGGEYTKLAGFEQPTPPPVLYPSYPGDPKLQLRLPSVRQAPMEPSANERERGLSVTANIM